MTDSDDIDWSELGTDAATVAAELIARAEALLEQLDDRGRAIAEIERRSAAMVEAQRHSSLRR